MKISKSQWNVALLACLVFTKVWAISDTQILEGLEELGDWEAAYPLAQRLAEQENTYHAWHQVAKKYAQFDIDKKAYLRAWQQAYQLNQVDAYKDFITLYPDSPLNLLAVQALFKLTQGADSVAAYQDFMENFPDSIEALQALLRVHELAFSHAQRLMNVKN